MLTYCLKYKRNTRNIDVKMIKTKNGRLKLPSKCDVDATNQDLWKDKNQKDSYLT